MKKYIRKALPLLLLGVAATPLEAQYLAPANQMKISEVNMEHRGSTMEIDMVMNLTDIDLRNTEAVVYTPVLVGNGQSVELESVGIYGRRRMIVDQRNGNILPPEAGEWIFLKRQRPASVDYSVAMPYQSWMNGAELRVERRIYGCGGEIMVSDSRPVDRYREWVYTPVIIYVRPAVKTNQVDERTATSSDHIDFIVQQSNIRVDYRQNRAELAQIEKTIDEIRALGNNAIKRVNIKGFASPEGPYDNNVNLSKARAASLENHVKKLYNFPAGVVVVSSEPVDWEGLRAWLDTVRISNRAAILDIVNSSLAPVEKNNRIKESYPSEYAQLLAKCYPTLRRADFTVEYTTRQQMDPAQIITLIEEMPEQVSLQEFFIAAESLPEGSDAYVKVYEKALSKYPNDTTINLNLANAALSKRDLRKAERYLLNAGDSAEADYARGVQKMLSGDQEGAMRLFRKVANKVSAAAEVLRQLEQNR